MSQIKIPHTDSRIRYSQLWITTPGPIGEEHTTSTEGETFGFHFNVSEGSTIEVHGGIRPTANPSLAPMSAYSLDDSQDAVLYTSPWVTNSTPVLSFFNSSALSAGVHTLSMRMMNNNSYYLDFLQINDASAEPPPAVYHVSSTTGSSPTGGASRGNFSEARKPFPAAGIAAVVFGSVIFMLCIFGAVLLWRRRARARRGRRPLIFLEPKRDSGGPALTPFTLAAPSPRAVRVQLPPTALPARDRRAAAISAPANLMVASDSDQRQYKDDIDSDDEVRPSNKAKVSADASLPTLSTPSDEKQFHHLLYALRTKGKELLDDAARGTMVNRGAAVQAAEGRRPSCASPGASSNGRPTPSLIVRICFSRVEPLLYCTLVIVSEVDVTVIDGLPTCDMQTFNRIIQTKSPAFLAGAVRNVILQYDNAHQARAILSACPGIENLYLTCQHLDPALVDPVFDLPSLRQLYCLLEQVFNLHSVDPFVHTTLAHITHLELLDDPGKIERHDPMRGIPLGRGSQNPGLCADEARHAGREVLASDFRGVMLMSYAKDWQLGILTGNDYWAQAEALITMRISGEVDRSAFFLEEERWQHMQKYKTSV
ncbi:hypothetical protein GGX14DRAFT_696381 [Mycena pura]|uniref:Uncharacterized protein n=1 Tax=Mycena pura TaxID=153505 RepID=A0AAD6VQF7_9AGAR|nr:hypothetical protein GGX14DRAFT_696381 [Mycena pura]